MVLTPVGRKVTDVAGVDRDSKSAETGTRLDGTGMADVESLDDAAGSRCWMAANAVNVEELGPAEDDDGDDAATQRLRVSICSS